MRVVLCFGSGMVLVCLSSSRRPQSVSSDFSFFCACPILRFVPLMLRIATNVGDDIVRFFGSQKEIVWFKYIYISTN